MEGSRRSRTQHSSYDFADITNNPNGLMAPLVLFGELYHHRRDTFKILFPKLHDEFEVMSENIEAVLSKKKARKENTFGIDRTKSLQRSSSVGSPRITSRGIGDEEDLTLDWFKVRTVDINDTPPAGGGQGGNGGGGGGQTGPKIAGGSK